MIVLEGADGTGKSTLAKIITSAFPQFEMIHSPGPMSQSTVKERLHWNTELTVINHIICDRISIISEMIYGPVLRGESLFTDYDLKGFLDYFKDHEFNMIVFCDRDFEQVRDYSPTLNLNVEEKKKLEKKVEDKSREIKHMYRRFFFDLVENDDEFPCRLNIVNVKTEDDVAVVLRKIKEIV